MEMDRNFILYCIKGLICLTMLSSAWFNGERIEYAIWFIASLLVFEKRNRD
jgi:hypothetical protein